MEANCLNCKDKERCMGFMYTPFVNCKYYNPIKDVNNTITKPKPIKEEININVNKNN